jgi:thiamine kinase
VNSKPPVLPRSLADLFTRWSPPGSVDGLPELEAVFSAGHSNRNFLLRHGDYRFVVRLPDRAAERLGIDRHVESRVLDCVSGLGFGPEVLLCEPESGVLVTRYLESRALRVEGLAADSVIDRLATMLRTLHAQPLDVPEVNIADRVRAYARELQSEDPRAWPRARRLLNSTRLVLEQYRFGRRPQALCHNDLVAANILESAGRICIIDWEYAGRGDPFFDLATLVEDSGFEALDRRQLLLAYGEIGDGAEERLYRARVLYRLLSALWFLLRHRGERPESIPALARHEQALERLLREGP